MEHPKVFLSHASEDKVHFVDEFALKLTEEGIDVWLDKWEMLPGDSLVDKIFEEGLKNAQAVIIVLSENSVSKPWVREELNTSIVNKLQKGTRIIPVVIDKCEVPQSLKSTLWEQISDTNDYKESLDRILASIYGKILKPKIGAIPAYTSSRIHEIAGLESIDSLILRLSCESVSEWPVEPIDPKDVFHKDNKEAPSKSQVLESIEILKDQNYLSVSYTFGGGSEHWGCHYNVTLYGYEEYCKAYINDYTKILDSAIGLIVNEDTLTNYGLRDKLEISLPLATHIIRLLENSDYVKVGGECGTRVAIYNVSAKLRRTMR